MRVGMLVMIERERELSNALLSRRDPRGVSCRTTLEEIVSQIWRPRRESQHRPYVESERSPTFDDEICLETEEQLARERKKRAARSAAPKKKKQPREDEAAQEPAKDPNATHRKPSRRQEDAHAAPYSTPPSRAATAASAAEPRRASRAGADDPNEIQTLRQDELTATPGAPEKRKMVAGAAKIARRGADGDERANAASEEKRRFLPPSIQGKRTRAPKQRSFSLSLSLSSGLVYFFGVRVCVCVCVCVCGSSSRSSSSSSSSAIKKENPLEKREKNDHSSCTGL